MDNREIRARQAVRVVKRDLSWLFSKEENRELYSTRMEAANIDLLVDLARDGDREALDILRKRARGWHKDALNAGRTSLDVPTSLYELLLEMFIYGPPKAKRGTGPKDTWLKYRTIAVLLGMICRDFGFPKYTAPEHRDDPDAPMSACRLLSEELELSERWIEEISGHHKAGVMRRSRRPPN